VAPRGATGKSPRGCGNVLAVAGGWRPDRSRNGREAGSLPDGGVRGSIDLARRRIPGSRARASEVGSRKNVARRLTSRSRARYRAQPCRARSCERPDPEPWWSELWRGRSPGEQRPGGPALARATGSEPGTDSRGEQGFEAGVPVAHTASPVSSGTVSRAGALTGVPRRLVSAVARSGCPGSCVHGPFRGVGGQTVRRSGESDRELLGGSAPAVIGSEIRKGAGGLRERVRLLGKGKLWRAVPGTRAAWNKAAKRRGPRRTAGVREDS